MPKTEWTRAEKAYDKDLKAASATYWAECSKAWKKRLAAVGLATDKLRESRGGAA